MQNQRQNVQTKESNMKIIKKLINIIVTLLTGKSEEAVDAGICDYSGQGRDSYGR